MRAAVTAAARAEGDVASATAQIAANRARTIRR